MFQKGWFKSCQDQTPSAIASVCRGFNVIPVATFVSRLPKRKPPFQWRCNTVQTDGRFMKQLLEPANL